MGVWGANMVIKLSNIDLYFANLTDIHNID
jgi:hypothetical protein